MPSCAVSTCKNTHRTKLSSISKEKLLFHRFPKGEISKSWEAACKRADYINIRNALICSDHFSKSDYERNLKAELLHLQITPKLKKDVTPTLNLPSCKPPSCGIVQREERRKIRERKQTVHQLLQHDQTDGVQLDTSQGSPIFEPDRSDDKIEISRWKRLYYEAEKQIQALENQLRFRNREISTLSQRYSSLQAISRKRRYRFQRQQATLEEKLREAKKKKVLSSLFSASQIKRLEGQHTSWTLPDVPKCLAILSISKKAYKILRETWKLPIPSERTLQRWLHKYHLSPGIFSPVIQLLKELASGMTTLEKICILSFDEMSITAEVDWDKSTDTIYGPHSKAQVAMISGICSNWRQPIFYDFDRKMTKELLFQILEEICEAGLLVKAVVSDLGGTNQELLNELQITYENSSFLFKNEPVHVFADMPHMLKLLRNHLIDGGWLINDALVNKSTMEAMILRDNGEIRLCPKLTLESINYSGAERMKVAPAAHLFSHRTATLARLIYPDYPAIANFIQDIDDLFDIFNSHVPEDNDKIIRSGFGLTLRDQMLALEKITSTILNMRCLYGKQNNLKIRKSMIPCQKGILMAVNSLKNLYDDLNLNYGVTYVLTRRLNQDPLESLFSVIRSLGRTNDNPLPSSFNSRMKILLFGSKLKPPPSSNVQFSDDHVTFSTSRLMEIATSVSNNLQPLEDDENDCENEPDGKSLSSCNDAEEVVEFGEDALHYLSGYIAAALKRKHRVILGEITRKSNIYNVGSDWIRRLSRGGLMIPCDSLFQEIQLCEAVFRENFRMDNLVNRQNITNIVCAAIKINIPLLMIKLLESM